MVYRVGVVGIAMVMALAGTDAGRASSTVLPSPEGLPENLAAVVSNLPARRGRITKAEFHHALVQTAAQAGRGSAPGSRGKGDEHLRKEAVDSLLEAAWVVGEAGEMGIAVTHGEVARELSSIRRQSFRSKAEYVRFLREAHFTKHDVYERVELQMLSTQIQWRLQARIERESRNPFEEQRAFKEFVAEFTEKWRARTVCAPALATAHCSNGQPPAA